MSNPISFVSIEQFLENAAENAIGLDAIKAIGAFDFKHYIQDREAILRKDEAVVIGFIPACLQWMSDRTVSVTWTVSGAQLQGGDIPAPTLTAAQDAQQFVKEMMLIGQAFWRQGTHPLDDGLNPFRDEKELHRVFCKKWGLNAEYCALAGVSDGTASDYPAEWKAANGL